MKVWRIVIVLLLCLVLASVTACNPLGGKEEATEKSIEVTRGDLTVTVMGSGNIEISNEMKLTFGVAGRVDTIYVEESDEASEGKVLANLETETLELAVTQAKIAYTQTQVAVTQAQVVVTQAQVAVTQAEINLENAKIARYQATVFQWPEIEVAQANVDKAKYSVKFAHDKLADATTDEDKEYWSRLVARAEEDLIRAEDTLNVILSGTAIDELVIKKWQVEAAQQSLEAAQQSLELAEQSLELAEQSPELAQQSLKLTQKQLDEAIITAPFAGVVASVNVDEGDTVSTVNKIIHLIDPTSMELNVEVDEIDISEVKLGQRAIIEVDALPALSLTGKVSSISLLSTEVGGVIVYGVKIEFDVPEGIGLKSGMSATADIVIIERNDVLLVPDRAIKEDSQGNSIVEVIVNGQIEGRPVVTGISDGFDTEIVDGLDEGELVMRKAS